MVCISYYENDSRLHRTQLRDPTNHRPPSQHNSRRCHHSTAERDDQGAEEANIRVGGQACRAHAHNTCTHSRRLGYFIQRFEFLGFGIGIFHEAFSSILGGGGASYRTYERRPLNRSIKPKESIITHPSIVSSVVSRPTLSRPSSRRSKEGGEKVRLRYKLCRCGAKFMIW